MISLIYCYVFPFKMTQFTISSRRIIVRDLQYLRKTQPGNVPCEPTTGRGLASAGSPLPLPVAQPRVKWATTGQDQWAKLIAGQKAPCRVGITTQPYICLRFTVQRAIKTPERWCGLSAVTWEGSCWTAALSERDPSQRFASQPGVTRPFLTSSTCRSPFPGTSSTLAMMVRGEQIPQRSPVPLKCGEEAPGKHLGKFQSPFLILHPSLNLCWPCYLLLCTWMAVNARW